MSHSNRCLFVIPHYYRYVGKSDLGSQRDPVEIRALVVTRTITTLHETFGRVQGVQPGLIVPDTPGNVIDVVLVSRASDHLVGELGAITNLFEHRVVEDEPMHLGFTVNRILAEAAGKYDRYAFVEDDLVVHDPLLFDKQDWFSSMFGSDSLLHPRRYESDGGLKVHPDGPLPGLEFAQLHPPPGPDRVEGDWFGLSVAFERPTNPHSGCYFVNGEQLERLASHPLFRMPHESFFRTIETAPTGPLVDTFCVYKATFPTSDFLEVEHQGTWYMDLWGLPDPAHVAEGARIAEWRRAEDAEARASVAQARATAAEGHAEQAQRQLDAIRSSRGWRAKDPLRSALSLTQRLMPNRGVPPSLGAVLRTEYLLTQVATGTHPQRDRGVDHAVQLMLSMRYQDLLRAGDQLPGLMETEATFFSQNGEDGVLLYLFALLGHGDRISAELCAGDGIECNTTNLIVNHAWHGLLVDGDEANVRRAKEFYAHSRQQRGDPPIIRHTWVTAESAPPLIAEAGVDNPLDLLVIDIDGMDYWVWRSLAHLRPRVVVVETNPALGEERVTLDYDPAFVRPDNVPFAGSSLPAIVGLGADLGYQFVGTERFGINAFFVRKDLVPDHLPLPSVRDVLTTSSVRRSARVIDKHLERFRGRLRWTVDPPGLER
jgi:hypothetical protein